MSKHSHIVLNFLKTYNVSCIQIVGEVREIKVPLSVSTVGLAAVAALAISGCKEFFAGWMERFGSLMYFCGPPT